MIRTIKLETSSGSALPFGTVLGRTRAAVRTHGGASQTNFVSAGKADFIPGRQKMPVYGLCEFQTEHAYPTDFRISDKLSTQIGRLNKAPLHECPGSNATQAVYYIQETTP